MLSSLAKKFPIAILALADGNFFIGDSVGAAGVAVGEMVFHTGMAGYQEVMTDPAYRGQIVTFTYPHMGNYGVSRDWAESDGVQAAALVLRNLSAVASNFHAEGDLSAYLVRNDRVAIAGVDTRQITRVLRDRGVQAGAILALPPGVAATQERIEEARAAARTAPTLVGQDLAGARGTRAPYALEEQDWFESAPGRPAGASRHEVVVYDLGARRSLLRALAGRGCAVTVVPSDTAASAVLARKPSGVCLIGGAGDPRSCTAAIASARELLASGVPLLGLGLGHQVMALAAGAACTKTGFAHRGVNHPVRDQERGRVQITGQDHAFAVDAGSLPAGVHATHVSLFDGTLQGLRFDGARAISFQGYPELHAGPRGDDDLLGRFTRSMGSPAP